jgi:hypothetical protein
MNKANIYLEKAFQLIDANPNKADYVPSISELLLAKAEATLDVTFPPTYKIYLKKYGTLGFGSVEIYGLTENEDFEHATIPNAIWLTNKYYKNKNLPKGIVLIYDTGDGDYYGIDTRQKNEFGESPVVLWMPGVSKPDDKLKIIAPDFGTFLYETIKNALDE